MVGAPKIHKDLIEIAVDDIFEENKVKRKKDLQLKHGRQYGDLQARRPGHHRVHRQL